MTWELIDQAGQLLIKDDIPSQLGRATTRRLLRQFSLELTKACLRFHDVVKSIPFEGERQAQSVVLPALHNVADAVYVEQPTTRKQKGESNTGWIDYWVYYEKVVFLIELKHSWIHMKKEVTLRSDTQQAWLKAQAQLKQVRKREIKDNLTMYSDNVCKVAMLLAPGYKWFRNEPNNEYFDENDADRLHQALLDNLYPAPNWSCVWAFSKHLQKEEVDEGWELYPGMAIITRVQNV